MLKSEAWRGLKAMKTEKVLLTAENDEMIIARVQPSNAVRS